MRMKLKLGKRKILIFVLASLMVLSSLFMVSGSYAYWSSDVSGANTTAIASINIGEWNQVFEWSSDNTYSQGDIVERNGVLYEARQDNPFFTPGGFLSWWSWSRL